MTAAVHDPVMERNIIQLRDGSLKRKFGRPVVVSYEVAVGRKKRTHHPPDRVRRLWAFTRPRGGPTGRRSLGIRIGHGDVGVGVLHPENFPTVGKNGIKSEQAA